MPVWLAVAGGMPHWCWPGNLRLPHRAGNTPRRCTAFAAPGSNWEEGAYSRVELRFLTDACHHCSVLSPRPQQLGGWRVQPRGAALRGARPRQHPRHPQAGACLHAGGLAAAALLLHLSYGMHVVLKGMLLFICCIWKSCSCLLELLLLCPILGGTVLADCILTLAVPPCLAQTGIPDADRFGHHDVVGTVEAGWRQQVFDRIRRVFGYGC